MLLVPIDKYEHANMNMVKIIAAISIITVRMFSSGTFFDYRCCRHLVVVTVPAG